MPLNVLTSILIVSTLESKRSFDFFIGCSSLFFLTHILDLCPSGLNDNFHRKKKNWTRSCDSSNRSLFFAKTISSKRTRCCNSSNRTSFFAKNLVNENKSCSSSNRTSFFAKKISSKRTNLVLLPIAHRLLHSRENATILNQGIVDFANLHHGRRATRSSMMRHGPFLCPQTQQALQQPWVATMNFE